ncbi:MAG: aldehyde dehydrogenase (NADP(+)) [Ferruginibacter sp.]
MKEEKQIIGYDFSGLGTETLFSYNPATGLNNDFSFYKATKKEVELAVEKAAIAFHQYRKKSGVEKAVFLEKIAEEIINTGDELITVCCNETGLPKGRIEGERMRTANQLKMFASLLREGSWVDARIETALPDRAPLPKPDIRSMLTAIGPVVVFGASNFPLAFSVAGGDTASALAAGCPVIVKAHSAHPATSALVGKAIQAAAKKTNMPDGVFSLLFGDGKNVGIQLVVHPQIKAVGFTGSFAGGKALFDAAAKRESPIPVYAEMGSTNPVFILPEALKEKADAIAAGFSGSVTLGVGQFCTNPGMLIYEKETTDFSEKIKEAFTKTSGGAMLAENIFKSYESGIAKHNSIAGVNEIAKGNKMEGSNYAQPVLFKTSSTILNEHTELGEEIFGPTSIIVEANSKEDLLDIAKKLSGHLTATVHGTENDLAANTDLLDILEQKVGRIVINGYPTGVEVCSAMVHGGPYPSTTDSRSTSVGTAAIFRFTRPVCFQSLPDKFLPTELQNKNILNIDRLVNSERSNKDII